MLCVCYYKLVIYNPIVIIATHYNSQLFYTHFTHVYCLIQYIYIYISQVHGFKLAANPMIYQVHGFKLAANPMIYQVHDFKPATKSRQRMIWIQQGTLL